MSDAETTVWINTEPSLDGSRYVVTLAADDDNALTLDPDTAIDYAWGVLDAAHRAAYDAAVAKQMSQKLGLDMDTVAQLVADLRKDRPEPKTVGPLSLEPGVNERLEPFLLVHVDGKRVGQWTFEDARQHALAALEQVKVADLDSGYYRALTGQVGIDGERARNVVDDLANYR